MRENPTAPPWSASPATARSANNFASSSIPLFLCHNLSPPSLATGDRWWGLPLAVVVERGEVVKMVGMEGVGETGCEGDGSEKKDVHSVKVS